MGHDHGGRHAARSRLIIAAALTAGYLAVEATVALATGSLTLLSDAGHMVTDLTGLLMALGAVTLATRGGARTSRTFGLYRLETLAALANAVLLFGVAGYVGYQAIGRFSEPVEVPPTPMLVVAAIGLVVNIGAYLLLRDAAQSSLIMRAAATEVFADALGSFGVLLAGGVIAATGARWVDPAVALALAVLILPRTWKLARQALRVLVEAAPEHIDVPSLERELTALPDVVEVHDLHVWTLTSGMELATAHLSVQPGTEVHPVLDAARRLLDEEYGIAHATLQVEPIDDTTCREVGW